MNCKRPNTVAAFLCFFISSHNVYKMGLLYISSLETNDITFYYNELFQICFVLRVICKSKQLRLKVLIFTRL